MDMIGLEEAKNVKQTFSIKNLISYRMWEPHPPRGEKSEQNALGNFKIFSGGALDTQVQTSTAKFIGL